MSENAETSFNTQSKKVIRLNNLENCIFPSSIRLFVPKEKNCLKWSQIFHTVEKEEKIEHKTVYKVVKIKCLKDTIILKSLHRTR